MRRTSVITNFIDVFSHHMRDTLRGVSFVGLISMPIKLDYAKARAAFSDCFSICYIQRAVEDKTTVLIYYKSRLAKLAAGRELRNLEQGEAPNQVGADRSTRRRRTATAARYPVVESE